MQHLCGIGLVVAMLAGATQLAAQQSQGKQHPSRQTAPAIKTQLIARMQVQYNTTSVDENELIAAGRSPSAIPASTFEMRRLRFGADVAYDEWMTGKFEMEFGMGKLAMRDVFVNLAFSPELQLRVGQFKKPFSLMQLTSETVWPVIERGVRIRGLTDALTAADSVAGGTRVLSSFKGSVLPGEEQELLEILGYQSYDLGASVHGKVGQFTYMVGAFNGPGSDRSDENGDKSFFSRAAYTLTTNVPVTLGAAIGRRDIRTASKPAIQSDAGTAYEADIEVGAFRRPGLRFMGEVATGRNLAAAADFAGAQGVLALFKPVAHKHVEGIEIAGRVSWGDPRRDIDNDEGMLITPGFNVYFTGRNRLMINWDVYRALGERLSGENALRMQMQFYY